MFEVFREQGIVAGLLGEQQECFVGVRGTLAPQSKEQLMMFAAGASRMIVWVTATFAVQELLCAWYLLSTRCGAIR